MKVWSVTTKLFGPRAFGLVIVTVVAVVGAAVVSAVIATTTVISSGRLVGTSRIISD